MSPSRALLTPSSGLIAMRLAQEFGSLDEFSQTLDRALVRGAERGATVVAYLDRGDMAIHLPGNDGPSCNAVPLVHLHAERQPSPQDWAAANAVIEKLERYR